jgi:hypothetical protein
VISAQEFITQARALVGVPWLHQGRSEFGVDCIGLVTLSCNCGGLDLATFLGVTDRRDYGRGAQPELLRRLREHCTRIYEPIDGCLIVVKFFSDPYPRHFGVYAAGNIIHADARAGRVVEHSYRGVWRRSQHSLWLLPGVIYGA